MRRPFLSRTTKSILLEYDKIKKIEHTKGIFLNLVQISPVDIVAEDDIHSIVNDMGGMADDGVGSDAGGVGRNLKGPIE